MSHRLTTATLVSMAFATLGAASCAPPARAPVAAPEPQASPAAPEPPPRCESLSEGCAAEHGKRVRISGTTLTFEPVNGWIYAQGDKSTVAQSVDGALWFSIAGYVDIERSDPRKRGPNRDAELEALCRDLDVKLPRNKISWKKPHAFEQVAGLVVSLWQVDGATRAGKGGAILMLTAPLGEGKTLVGVAFVSAHDQSDADQQILASIRSIAWEGTPVLP